jgi:hypothetical protein
VLPGDGGRLADDADDSKLRITSRLIHVLFIFPPPAWGASVGVARGKALWRLQRRSLYLHGLRRYCSNGSMD